MLSSNGPSSSSDLGRTPSSSAGGATHMSSGGLDSRSLDRSLSRAPRPGEPVGGGTLHSLSSEVKASAEALAALREKMDNELWKGVLKSEASLVEKERSLNEVQAKREQLWGQREAIVAAMQAELGAEQTRMARMWQESFASWEKVQGEHEGLKRELHARRVEAEEVAKAVHQQMHVANATLQAEVSMMSQERALCREERREVGVALVSHKAEVSKHREWLFGAMQTVAREREQGVYTLASEGAKLEAQRRAADASQRNAAYERSLVNKEREAGPGAMVPPRVSVLRRAAKAGACCR